jgi:hypothetical protein
VHIDLTFDEARTLALRGAPLPPMLSTLTCEDDTVYATVDLRAIPNPPAALRFAAALAPQVQVALRYESYGEGVLGLRVTASAAGLPVQKLLGFAEGPLRSFLQEQGLPGDAVTISTGQGDPLARVRVQDVADLRAPGLRVTGIDLAAGRIALDGEVGPSFSLR